MKNNSFVTSHTLWSLLGLPMQYYSGGAVDVVDIGWKGQDQGRIYNHSWENACYLGDCGFLEMATDFVKFTKTMSDWQKSLYLRLDLAICISCEL